MRKTAKKLLALILTLAMLVSTFAMAMISVNAAESAPILKEDFEGTVNIDANKNYSSEYWLSSDVNGKNAANNVYVETIGDNKVLNIATSASGGRYQITGKMENATDYQLTFDVYFVTKPYMYVCTAGNRDNGIFQFLEGSSRTFCTLCYNKGTADTADDDVNAGIGGVTASVLKQNVWYTVTLTVNGTKATLTAYNQDSKATEVTMTRDFNCGHVAASKAPLLALYTSRDVKLDNLVYQRIVLEDGENVLPNNWTAFEENFENVTLDAYNGNFVGYSTTTPGFKGHAGLATQKGVGALVEENGNKYLKVKLETINNAEEKIYNSRYYLSPWLGEANVNSLEKGKYYTLSTDVYFPSTTKDVYHGLQIRAGSGSDSFIWQVFTDAVRSYDLAANTIDNRVSNVLPFDTWVTVIFERNGNTITTKLVNRDTGAVLYNQSRTFANLTADLVPQIYLTQGNAPDANKDSVPDATWTSEMYFDNVRYENTTGKLDVVGVQSTAVANDKYSVRFIGTVNSTHVYDKLGFEVVASYTEGGVAKTKTFKLDTCQVYTSILASGAGNAPYVVSASQLGGEYLIALNITDIPSDLGEITFTVKAFGYYNNGIEVRSEVASFTATPNGDAVELAKA